MLVSTCRIDVQPDLRRAYLLHITNLEDRPYDYLLTFVLTAPLGLMGPAAPGPQELDQFLRFTSTSSYFIEQTFRRMVVAEHHWLEAGAAYSMKVRVLIGGQQTKSIVLEPMVFTGFGGLASAFGARPIALDHLEGYVTLRLPTKLSNAGQFFNEPQTDRPVRVLVNPETRTRNWTAGQRMDIWHDDPPVVGIAGPRFDPPPVQNGFTYAPSTTIERIEPLHVATGKAENELQPESARSLTIESLAYALDAVNAQNRGIGDYRGAATVAQEDRAGALVELLMEMGEDPELARAINKVLEDQQAPVRIRHQ